MWIRNQDRIELINLDNVLSIYYHSDYVNGKFNYYLNFDTPNGYTNEIGVYDSEEKAQVVIGKIKSFISGNYPLTTWGNHIVFDVPGNYDDLFYDDKNIDG